MASFLHQLKVLLWKNWLSVYRQPVWSLVLIVWPVVIFVILAMTRIQHLPDKKSVCYLAPRNLPSAGLMPFMLNFLCQDDYKCKNTSYVSSSSNVTSNSNVTNKAGSRSRLKKRSVDSGGGGTTFQTSSSDANFTAALEALHLVKTIVQDLHSGDLKGALCNSIHLFVPAQKSDLQDFCNTNKTLETFIVQALFSQASSLSSTEVLLAVESFSSQLKMVQNKTALWNFFLMLPEWIKNPERLINAGEYALNLTAVAQEIPYLQTCVKFTLKFTSQVQNSSASNLTEILQSLSAQSTNSEIQSCISFLQQVSCGSSQCWLDVGKSFEILYWLVTSLGNETSRNACEFNGLNIVCYGSINWDIFLQTSLSLLKEVSIDPPAGLIRVVQRTWTMLKQNAVDQMILQKLEQEITSSYPSDPQLQTVLRQLVHLLLNATDLLLTESSQYQFYSRLWTLLEQINILVPPELLNMQSIHSTDTISNLTQTIVKNILYWVNLSGLLSSSNVTSQTLVDLQILTNALSTISSEIATFNDSTILLKILSITNQPAFKELQTSLQTLLNLKPITLNITSTLIHAFNLFSKLMTASNPTNSSLLVNFYLQQILTFLNTETTLQDNLTFLNSYFDYNQLAFLQSEAFTNNAADILSFFAPSHLQTMSSNPNNVSLELMKLISSLIPDTERDLFHNVENFFATLLDTVSTCQMELSNCTGSIFMFQQQLQNATEFITALTTGNVQQIVNGSIALQFAAPSQAQMAVFNKMFLMISCSQARDNSSCNTAQDIYKNTLGELTLILNMTLENGSNLSLPLVEQLQQNIDDVLQALGSVDLTKLTSQLSNITRLSKCYMNTLVNPLQCTMELTTSLADLLQMLPFPQPTDDIILAVLSVAQTWLGEMNGTVDIYQQLTYLYDVSTVAFHNQSTLREIYINLLDVVDSLGELRANANLSSIATGKLIGDLLETLKAAKTNYAFPATLLSQTNQELENLKTQLQTVRWYILCVKNQTEAFQTTSNTDPFVTMAQLIVGIVLSSIKSNPSLMPIAGEAQYVTNLVEKFDFISTLHSILNDTLQGGDQSIDMFINHTMSTIEMIIQQEFVNRTRGNPLLNEISDSDLTFVLQLLQEYDGERLANLSSVLSSTEKVLLTVETFVNDLYPETVFNYNLQTIYNISQQVMYILYHAEYEGSMNKTALYDIYNLFLECWDGNILHEFPWLKNKLMELLHLSVQCLSASTAPSLTQNCSATDITHTVQLILNDLGCQISLVLPMTDGNMTLSSILEDTTWQANTSECAIESTAKEELACLAKNLETTVQLISRTNHLLGLDTTWVPEMDAALPLITDKLSAHNVTCVAIDRQIGYIIYQMFESQSTHLQSLIYLFSNQTLYTQDLSQYSENLLQVSNIVKLYASNQADIPLNDTVLSSWNDIMLQLFEVSQMSTTTNKSFVASELQKTVSNFLNRFGSVEESLEMFHILNILNRVTNLTSVSLRLNSSMPHISLANIFDANFSMIAVKLIKKISAELNITSVESCENSLLNHLDLYRSRMNLSIDDTFYSNISSWTCGLILRNNSRIDWLEELKAITSMVITAEAGTKVDNIMKIIASFIQSENFTSVDMLDSLVTSLIQILNGKEPPMNQVVYQTLHESVNSLESIVKEALSGGNSSSISTVEKITVNAIGAVNRVFKSLNITGYEEILLVTSEIFQIYFITSNSTEPMDALLQKILERILTVFQNSGLENAFIHTLESQILSLSSEKQTMVQNFLHTVMSAINDTASESATQTPVDSFLTLDCSRVIKILTAVHKMVQNAVPSSPWSDETQLSNLTMDICGLLHWNHSQNDWVSMVKSSRRILLYAEPLVPDSMRKYCEAASYILGVVEELVAQPALTQNNLASFMNIVPVINELFDNVSGSTGWMEDKTFQKLIYFLLDIAWWSSSPKEVLLLKVQNFILVMIQDIQNVLKPQHGSPDTVWLSFALDVVERFINRTQNTSSEYRFLVEVWDSLKESGLENMIISAVGELVSNNGSDDSDTLKHIIQFIFNLTDLIISETSLSPSHGGNVTVVKILQLVLSDLLQSLLPQSTNTAPALEEDLQSASNVTSLLSQLEMFINKLSAMENQANSSNDPTILFHILSAMNQSSFISEISNFLQVSNNSKNIQYGKLFMGAVQMFQDFVQMNKTINIQDLSDIFGKYLLIYLDRTNETQSTLNAILTLWQHLSNLTNTQSSDLSNTVIQLLPSIQSHILINESTDVSNVTSWLVSLISGYLPAAERGRFERAANASLLLIDSVQSCSVRPWTCTDLTAGIQNFVLDVRQMDSIMQNRTLANSSLPQFDSYDQSQITLINEMFMVLSEAMGQLYNSTTNQTGVYEEVLTLKDWLLNMTMEDNVNITAPPSLQNLVDVLSSANVTHFLLQIENLVYTSNCSNQAGIDPSLCKLDLMLHLTQLLQILPLGQATHDTLSVVSSVAGEWLSQFHGSVSTYQQLIDFYNVTVLAIQYQPMLQVINTSLVNIVHILQDMGALLSVNLSDSDIALNLFSEIIQKAGSESIPVNISTTSQSNISELLEAIKLQLDTVNWLMLQVNNKPTTSNSPQGAYAIDTIAQWIDNYQNISIIIRNSEFIINSLIKVVNLTDLLHIFNDTIQNAQLQGLLYQIASDAFTKVPLIGNLLTNGNTSKDAEIAALLLQEMNSINTSMILTSINQVSQTIQGIKGLAADQPFLNSAITGRVFQIVKEGMEILYNIQARGTIGKEAIYQIYNFTYLLVQDEWNWVPFQNLSAMEAELLDVFYLAMSPFLGGNGSQAYTGNCSTQDVLQILVQTIFSNGSDSESLVQTTCNWQFAYNSSDSGPSINHTLTDMIYLALQSSPMFHSVCSNDALHPLAEEITCLVQVMGTSMGVLADLNNISGLQIPLIQSLNNSLTFISNNMPSHNFTFQTDTQLVQIVNDMIFNQSNPIHLFIQFLINHYSSTIQTSDLLQLWTELSNTIKALTPLSGLSDNHIYELIEAAVNLTFQPSLFESWQALDNVLSMNWTFVISDASLSVLETVRRAVVLINCGLDAKTLQIYKAIVSLVKDLNFAALIEATNPTLMNATVSSVAECTAALNALARFSDSIWAAVDPTHSTIKEELLSNFSLLACEVFIQPVNYTWISTLENIITSLAYCIPVEITQYFTALQEIISFLSDIQCSPDISQEDMIAGVYELFIQELRIFSNTTIITDWIEIIPVRYYTSILFELRNNVTAEQVVTLERDFFYLLSSVFNATSYVEGLSMLSDFITYLPDNISSLTTANDIKQKCINLLTTSTVTVHMTPLTGPYGTVMNCLKNETEDFPSHLPGHLEVAIRLAQDLFTQSNKLSNASMIPDLLQQKIYQLQNLTTVVCDLVATSDSQSYCYMPCLYLTLLQDVADIVNMAIAVTQSTTSINSQEIITSLLSRIWQSFENEISNMLGSVIPASDLTSLTTLLSNYSNVTNGDSQATLGNIFTNVSHVEEQLRQVVQLNQTSITALMNVQFPDDKTQIVDWFITLSSTNLSLVAKSLQVFCNLPPEQGYQMALIFLQNVDIIKLAYRLLMPPSWQTNIDILLAALKKLIENVNYIFSILNQTNTSNMITNLLNLMGSSSTSSRTKRSVDLSELIGSTRADSVSLTDILRLVCRENYEAAMVLLYNSLSNSGVSRNSYRAQNLSQLYSIPTDNTFCLKLFTSLVTTTTGASTWLLLKPLLYGKILYTPYTNETQKIMEKTKNHLLQIENYKNTINNLSTGMQDVMNVMPVIQRILQRILNNTVISGILTDILQINITDVSQKIDFILSKTYLINYVIQISKMLVNLLSCVETNRIQPFNSVAEMTAEAERLQATNDLFAAVTFHLSSRTSGQKRSAPGPSGLPKQISYSITMRSLLSEDTAKIRDTIWVPGPHDNLNKYSRGFVYLQESIDRAIIEMQTNTVLDNVALQFQPMPYPCYKRDSFLYSMGFALPIALMITWVLFIAAFVKKLVLEKELRLHEYMKMMGVNSSSHFFAWLIESASFLIISSSIIAIILKFGKLLALSNGFIVFLFLLDYSLTLIAMSYLISVFFHNTNVAALCGSLIYIITFFPFIALVSKDSSLSFVGKTLLSLFSPTALSYATQYIISHEEQNEGIQWHNLYSSPRLGDTFNFGWLCWMMLIDAMIYFIVGFYIRVVFPGKYGIGAVWYFPVLPSFWMECCGCENLYPRKPSGLRISNIVSHSVSEKKGDDLYPHNEQEPSDLNVGVSLHGLTKAYQDKLAVHNLNLNFYEGHITSLLGHNGAGKTTTLSMLMGLFSATSGTIYVYGEDIRTQLNQVRKNMGVCMQYDVLIDHLTTKEHLLLYGSIKAPQLNKKELHCEVKRVLKDTGLYNHRYKPVMALSGGMKRKLSIGIALIGGSKVVILDEPTTGVDPCSRRSIWEVISKNKKDKTIILSTHHLDEAEILSDRIAFLEQGGLRCCGTPMFLKKKFGSGYHLTITKKFPDQNDDRLCDSEEVTALIHSHIPEATLKEDVGGELVYVLPPFSADIANAYLALLRDLDTNLNDLHIGCYGISDTTIEEVFLKLVDNPVEDSQGSSRRAINIPNQDNLLVDESPSAHFYNVSERDDQPLTEMENIKGWALRFKKIRAIFIKRFHNSKRNWKGLISQILLPVLFVIAAMGLGSLSMSSVEYPEVLLSPNMYGTTDQAVVFGLYNKSSEDLMDATSLFPGIDNSCLNQNSQCLPENSLGSWNKTGNQTVMYGSCNCSTGYAVCAAPEASPPHRRTYSRQMLYNVTGNNMEDYLLATTLNFIQKRYGGWSFGIPASTISKKLNLPANLTVNKVWYNNEGPHSLPAFLNSFSNLLLRSNLPRNESAQYGINIYNKPLPGTVTSSSVTLTLVNTLVALSVLVGYSIMTASFATYVVKEYNNGSKRLQHIAGVGEVGYWVTNFLYDLAIYLVPVALSIAMIAAFKLPAFYNYPNLGALSILFILFGYATFPWMYLIAGTFKSPGMAFISYVCINLFIGINTIISSSVVYMLMQNSNSGTTDITGLNSTYNAIVNVFKIFPQFCFGYGLIELSQQQAIRDQLSVFGNYEPVDIFSMDILGYMFVAMTVQGTFCLVLRLLMNDGIIYSVNAFFKKTFRMYPNLVVKNPEEDEDVLAERERVESGQPNEDLLLLKGLTKRFHQVNKNVIAVNNMSLGIPPGECFGLLGVNGAGKTTTFKMLTRDLSPSAGNIQIRKHTGDMVDIFGFNTDWSSFGYCPQEDALDELMTGVEHLYYYARIHGIPEKKIKSVTNDLLKKLELVQYKDKITANYSCGTRRKLSTALALIGRPSILLLDEPSSGMDPKTKRHLWKIIAEEIQNKCAVVLTSHSMEECEALCTRLAIMVRGTFQCIGSLQHIKSRFGSGFTVKMHLKDSSNVEAITGFMHLHFPNTYLKEQHFTMAEYHVPVSAGGVASIFELLEANKLALNIIHFSVSQTTLDEVFINFAQSQSSPDNSSASSLESQQIVVA